MKFPDPQKSLLRSVGFAALLAVVASAASAQPAVIRPVPGGSIERLGPEIDRLVPPGALVEKIATGFRFIEGPVWIEGEAEGHLLFSDIPANKVYRWGPEEGLSVFLDRVMPEDAKTGASGGSNGLLLDLEGRVVLCEHGNRRVARLEANGSRIALAERYEGKRLNSPNDGVYHSSGALFFTDPPYGLSKQDEDPAKELSWNGIYRLDPDGGVTLLAQQKRPNGIGLSPDEKTLYVANSDREDRFWMAYRVRRDLSLGEGSIFFDGRELSDPGVPDGLAVDGHGNVWATGPGGVVVISPDGRHLGTIKPEELPANAGFGEGGRYLYMTARTSLYRLRVNTSLRK